MNSGQRQRILEQYASDAGRSLYRHVMGDGGEHIHFGLYRDAGTPMREALEASCRRLLELARSRVDPASLRDILDLGAGAGGPAKCLLAWTGASLTCVDLGEGPLRELDDWAAGAGLASRLRTWVGSYGCLPPAWSGGFDLAWSQDALCHAEDRAAVFSEARRALRPGGAFVFSDILLADSAPPEEARAFTAVNAVQHLGTARDYARDLARAGFSEVHCEDWTPHLAANFGQMLGRIRSRRGLMRREGVGEDLLEAFERALETRLRWTPGSVLEWRAYACLPGGRPAA